MTLSRIFKLIEVEYLKFRKNAVVQVILGFVTIGIPLLILSGARIMRNLPPPFPSSDELFEFPTIWEYQGYIGSWFLSVFLGFLTIQLYASEVSYRTLRQTIINGYTRSEFFISKFATILILCIYATLLYYISCIIIGIVHTDAYDMELIFDNNWAGFRFFLSGIGHTTFALLLAILIRRGTLTLIVYLLYMFMAEPFIRWYLLFKLQVKAPNYAPLNTIEDLFPNPLLRLPDFFSINELKFEFLLDQNYAIFGSILYVVLFVGLSWMLFKKKDL